MADESERKIGSLLRERDEAVDMADTLAEAIAGLLGVSIGDHTNANDPWQNALAAVRKARKARSEKECLCFGVAGRRVPPSRQPCPRHGDQATWEGADELTAEAERLGLDYFGENDDDD